MTEIFKPQWYSNLTTASTSKITNEPLQLFNLLKKALTKRYSEEHRIFQLLDQMEDELIEHEYLQAATSF